MQQRTLGKTGLPVSALTREGEGIGMVWSPTTDEECIATAKAAVASGITMLELTPLYGKGKSEEIVGHAWRDLSTKPLIATKVFIMPDERKDLAGAVQRFLEGSLRQLGLSHLDVLQLHNQIEPLAPRNASPRSNGRSWRGSNEDMRREQRHNEKGGSHGTVKQSDRPLGTGESGVWRRHGLDRQY